MAGRVGSDINALMQGGLEEWLESQQGMREGAKKQATNRWVWGAVILMPLLAFLWFSPAPPSLSGIVTLAGVGAAVNAFYSVPHATICRALGPGRRRLMGRSVDC